MNGRYFNFDELFEKSLAGDELALSMLNHHIYFDELTTDEIAKIVQTASAEKKKPDDQCNGNALVLSALVACYAKQVSLSIELLEHAKRLNNQPAWAVRGQMYLGAVGCERDINAAHAHAIECTPQPGLNALMFLEAINTSQYNPNRNEALADVYRRQAAELGSVSCILHLIKACLSKKENISNLEAQSWLRKLRTHKYGGSRLTQAGVHIKKINKLCGNDTHLQYQVAMLCRPPQEALQELFTKSPVALISAIIDDDLINDETKFANISSTLEVLTDANREQLLHEIMSNLRVKKNKDELYAFIIDLIDWLFKRYNKNALLICYEFNPVDISPVNLAKLFTLQSTIATYTFNISVDIIQKGQYGDFDKFELFLHTEEKLFERQARLLQLYKQSNPAVKTIAELQLIDELNTLVRTCKNGLWDMRFSSHFKLELNRDLYPIVWQPLIEHLNLFLAHKANIDKHANKMAAFFKELHVKLQGTFYRKLGLIYLPFMPNGVDQMRQHLARHSVATTSNIDDLYKCMSAVINLMQKDKKEGEASRHPTTTALYQWTLAQTQQLQIFYTTYESSRCKITTIAQGESIAVAELPRAPFTVLEPTIVSPQAGQAQLINVEETIASIYPKLDNEMLTAPAQQSTAQPTLALQTTNSTTANLLDALLDTERAPATISTQAVLPMQPQPFTAEDLQLLERLSILRASPAAKEESSAMAPHTPVKSGSPQSLVV